MLLRRHPRTQPAYSHQVIPFLADFYAAPIALRPPAGVRADGLIRVSRRIARVVRRLVGLRHVMGHELLRRAVDYLLDALLKKTLVEVYPAPDNSLRAHQFTHSRAQGGYLVADGDGEWANERRRMVLAMRRVDEWDDRDGVRSRRDLGVISAPSGADLGPVSQAISPIWAPISTRRPSRRV